MFISLSLLRAQQGIGQPHALGAAVTVGAEDRGRPVGEMNTVVTLRCNPGPHKMESGTVRKPCVGNPHLTSLRAHIRQRSMYTLEMFEYLQACRHRQVHVIAQDAASVLLVAPYCSRSWPLTNGNSSLRLPRRPSPVRALYPTLHKMKRRGQRRCRLPPKERLLHAA